MVNVLGNWVPASSFSQRYPFAPVGCRLTVESSLTRAPPTSHHYVTDFRWLYMTARCHIAVNHVLRVRPVTHMEVESKTEACLSFGWNVCFGCKYTQTLWNVTWHITMTLLYWITISHRIICRLMTNIIPLKCMKCTFFYMKDNGRRSVLIRDIIDVELEYFYG